MAHAARLEHDAAAQRVVLQRLANAVRSGGHEVTQAHTVETAMRHHRQHVAKEVDRRFVGTGQTAAVTHEQWLGVNTLQLKPMLDGIHADGIQIRRHLTQAPCFVVAGTDGTQQRVGKHIVAAVQQRGDDFGQLG